MLVGAMPRKEGMDRADLLSANGKIFTGQGKALNDAAADDIKVLVTGNPANTNALIAMTNAPDIPNERFNALTRLDHNRAKTQLAKKLGVPVTEISNLAIWGNHDDSMYPDLYNTKVGGKVAADLVDESWITDEFIPTVAKRGGAIIAARGLSSAASAANATIDHMRDWVLGTDDWVSMSVPSDGSYGVTEGIVSSFPCTVKDGTLRDRPGHRALRLLQASASRPPSPASRASATRSRSSASSEAPADVERRRSPAGDRRLLRMPCRGRWACALGVGSRAGGVSGVDEREGGRRCGTSGRRLTVAEAMRTPTAEADEADDVDRSASGP